jgi:hypothetical protein
MNPTKPNLKDLIREGVRTTIHNTLASVIQEVTEEELRAAFRDPALKEPLMEVIRLEIQQAFEELKKNGRPKPPHKR